MKIQKVNAINEFKVFHSVFQVFDSHTLYLLARTINKSHKDLNWVSGQATILDLSFIHQKLQLMQS
jgi:hypothetical protein